MWVIKIGGSWITNPYLPDLLSGLREKKREKIIIVPGGGCFADSIRFAHKKTEMSDFLGNKLALKSTEFFAYYLNELDLSLKLTKKIENFSKTKINVWLPSNLLIKEKSFTNNWDSTSDSVAAWLSKTIQAKGLVYIKSLKKFEKINDLKKLQKKNIMDRNCSIYLKSYNGLIKIAGLDVLRILKKNSNWNSFIENLCSIKK